MGPVTPTIGSGIFALLPGSWPAAVSVTGSADQPGTAAAGQSPINAQPGRAESIVDPQQLADLLDPILFGDLIGTGASSSTDSDQSDPTSIGYDQFGAAEAFNLASLGSVVDLLDGDQPPQPYGVSQNDSAPQLNTPTQISGSSATSAGAPTPDNSTPKRWSALGVGLTSTAFDTLYG